MSSTSSSSVAASPDRITDEQYTGARAILKKFPYKWEEIGTGLGFTSPELTAIQNRPALFLTAPLSWLNAMLTDWHQWTPTDARGSGCYPTLRSLRTAVSKAGLEKTAEDLDKVKQGMCAD